MGKGGGMTADKSIASRVRALDVLAVLLFLVFPLGLVFHKIVRVGYDIQSLLPVETYKVSLSMTCTGHGDSLWVRTYLPQQDARVMLSAEKVASDLPGHLERFSDDNRIGEWHGGTIDGARSIRVEYTAYGQHVRYDLDAGIPVPGPPPERRDPFLAPTAAIQVDDADIGALAEKLAPTGSSLDAGLRAMHDYCQKLGYVDFKGETDALTALRLGEASCNGKSRLFVALARHQGLPARLVGGLILEPGVKRTSHQWAEVRVGPHWIPYCPTNGHVARIPANYLPLYHGDQVLFAHSTDINFRYKFAIERGSAIRPETMAKAGADPLNLLSIWTTFARAGIPLELLKVVLMIPLGALVIVILRNVIGLETFGTFLPALIAVASRDTGLGWGLVSFVALILLVFLVRLVIARFQLLHLPHMAILLTFVIIFILLIAVLGVRMGSLDLAKVSLFPLAIMAITTERFSIMVEEEGARRTIGVALMTVFSISACYFVMNALTFQILFMSFPELLLVVIFLDLWLGRWMGLRVLEYWRFRKLLTAH